MKCHQALGSILRAPGFAAFPVLVMALGIGLTTVAFFALNAVFLQPLDLPQPDRLVRIHLPAWRVWRSDVRESLAHASSRSAASDGENLRSGLLVAEVAFSVLHLTARGRLLRGTAATGALAAKSVGRRLEPRHPNQ